MARPPRRPEPVHVHWATRGGTDLDGPRHRPDALELTVPASGDIDIAFDNTDPGVPHGLALYADRAHAVTLGTAPLNVGPDHRALRIAALGPGRYWFSCVVHATMEAALVVGPSD
jgi:hypothetical protein